MERKSTRVGKTLRKRLFVVGLTVALVGNTIDFSVLSASAKTETVETETAKEGAVSSNTIQSSGVSDNAYMALLDEETIEANETDVDAEDAIVRIDVTKNSGTDSTYYSSWKAATDYLSDNSSAKEEFGDWKSVKIALLKDASIDEDVAEWGDVSLCAPITVCSENGTHTLTGSGYTTVIDCFYKNITLQDIKIEGGFIEILNANLTLKEGVEVSGAPYKAKKGQSTIRLSKGELELDNAAVTSTTQAEGFYAVDLYDATLRINGANTQLASAYIAEKTVTAVIDESSADDVPAFYGNTDSQLEIFYTGKSNAKSGDVLASYTGESEVWYQVLSEDGTALLEDKNTETVTSFEDETYGLYSKNKQEAESVIYVDDNACNYIDSTGSHALLTDNNKYFMMPESYVTITAHNWGEDGQCKDTSCNKVNIEKAYANKALTIEGLDGRTYDSYPQILSKITWKSVDGDEKKLTAPMYNAQLGYGTLGFGGDKTVNTPDYTVVYKNNVEAYSLEEGEENFDATKAPQVTITGKGDYVGSFTIYFTIGKGEMRLGDFDVCGAKNAEIVYNGKEHKAWNAYAVEFKPDEGDKLQFSQLGDGEYIKTCDTTEAMYWYGPSWSDPNQVEYSTDDQKTWIVEKEFGAAGDKEKMYMITDAGDHPFYIKVTNKSCGELISDQLIAKITPKDLNSKGITFDNSENVTAYYTGKSIIPTAWDDKLVDTDIKVEKEDSEVDYTLVRDKDFIVTGEDNTDISDHAKVTITGKGNYKGELSANFQIKPAFTLKQTTISTENWYTNNPTYWVDGGVPVVFSEGNAKEGNGLRQMLMQKIVYRDSKEDAAGLSGQVEFYTSLEDAVAGTNPGYTFTQEGVYTQILYGKDPVTGYISEPVDVTLKIDTTAPTWENEDDNTEDFGIRIQENWWRKLLNTVSFGHFYNDNTLEIKIKANDKKKGVNGVSDITQRGASYYCYMQEIDDTAADGEVAVKTKDELDELPQGTTSDIKEGFIRVSIGAGSVGTVKDALKNDGNYIVYAYATDTAGNQSDYICTEGIVVDANAPIVTVSEPKKENGTLKDTKAILNVNLNEDATLMWFFVSEGEFQEKDSYTYDDCKKDVENYMNSDPKYQPFAVQKDGKWDAGDGWFNEPNGLYVAQRLIRNNTDTYDATSTPAIFRIEGTKGDNTIEISDLGQPERFFPLYPSKKTAVWIAAIDKAGNITAPISPIEFTMTNAIPKITKDPVLTGTYGDTVQDLVITDGEAAYNGEKITGTWEITDTSTDVPVVGDTKSIQVTFTPDADIYGDTYETTVVYVTPTITPCPIIIKVADLHKTYGEPCPGVDNLDFIIDKSTPLVAGDTRDTIKENLVIEIPEEAAKQDSDCGKYRIDFKLENKNYNVTEWKCYAYLTNTNTVEYCQLVIEKAAGKINTLPEYHATQNVQYQYEGEFATFDLGVEASHKEAALQYTIADAKKANGDTITDAAKLLSVSADGKVTIKGAGSAKIMISLPETKNYTAATMLVVEVNIEKADITIPDFVETSIYANKAMPDYDMISRNELDAERLGGVIYGDGSDDNKDAIIGMTIQINGTVVDHVAAQADFFDQLPYLADNGKVLCAIKSFDTYEPKTAIVSIPVTTENCTINGGAGIVFHFEKTDKLTVQPDAEVKAELTYGEALSEIGFEDVTFVDTADSSISVPGTFEWEMPDAVLAVGTHQVKYMFIPSNKDYKQYEGTVTVTVNKAKAKLTKAPVVNTYIYDPLAVLREEILNDDAKEQGFVAGIGDNQISGTWHFVDTAVVNKPMKAGNNSYEIYFTPDVAYEAYYDCSAVKTTITVTVKKAVPYISTQPQPAEAYTHGDHLNMQELIGTAVYGNGMGGAGNGTEAKTAVAGTFTWKTPSTKTTYLGNKTFDYIFTPEDTDSYEAVTGSVTITVNQAQNAPYMPDSEMNVAYSYETVGSVELPQDWKWSDTDAATALLVDTAVFATAVYDGADKGSYVNESVTIQITRAACEHAKTEIKGAVKATCATEGNTGETWCLICGKKISDGVTIPKDATNHTSLVSKQLRPATTTQEGIMSYSCSACGYYEEKPIAKIVASEDPSDSPTPTTTPKPSKTPEAGTILQDDKKAGTYQVTSAEKKEVTYMGAVNKKTKNVTIPATIKIDGVTYKVTKIAEKAFKGNKKVQKIVIGKNVKQIGADAFRNCKNLKKIVIRTTKLNDKNVHKKAFRGVTKKTVITVPSKKRKAYKTLLRKKSLPKSVTIKKA